MPVAHLKTHVGNKDFAPVSPGDLSCLRILLRDSVSEFSSLTGLDVSDWLTLTDTPLA